MLVQLSAHLKAQSLVRPKVCKMVQWLVFVMAQSKAQLMAVGTAQWLEFLMACWSELSLVG